MTLKEFASWWLGLFSGLLLAVLVAGLVAATSAPTSKQKRNAPRVVVVVI